MNTLWAAKICGGMGPGSVLFGCCAFAAKTRLRNTAAQKASNFMPIFYHGQPQAASHAGVPLDNHNWRVHDHGVGQLSTDIYEQIVQLRRDGRRGAVATIVNVRG